MSYIEETHAIDEAPKPSSNRDAKAALAAAAGIVKKAEAVSVAVISFHEHADRIEEANAIIDTAKHGRLDAVKAMRLQGLPVSEIAALTGLSASRINSLLKG